MLEKNWFIFTCPIILPRVSSVPVAQQDERDGREPQWGRALWWRECSQSIDVNADAAVARVAVGAPVAWGENLGLTREENQNVSLSVKVTYYGDIVDKRETMTFSAYSDVEAGSRHISRANSEEFLRQRGCWGESWRRKWRDSIANEILLWSSMGINTGKV